MNGQTKSLDALTGLRFVAAFAVFVHHVGSRFGATSISWPLGAQAVSFFFVLSGFILTYVYHDRLSASSIKKFYFTRCVRIWPLHFACLFISIALLGLDYWLRNPDFLGQLLATLFLVQSWIPNDQWAFAINGVSWSISTEMFFYLLFPLFLIGGAEKFWRKYLGVLCLTALAVPAMTWISHSSAFPNVNFARMAHTNPIFRLPEFCTGMAMGFVYLQRRNLGSRVLNRSLAWDTFAEFSCLFGIFAYRWLIGHYHVIAQLNRAVWGGPFLGAWFNFTSGCLVFGVTIYVFSRSRGIFARLLGSRGMVFLGELSFAFYMIHQIVIRTVIVYSRYYEGIGVWEVSLCVLCISIGVSIVLHKLIEIPAKQAWMRISEGRFRSAISIPWAAGVKFCTSRLLVATALMCLIPAAILSGHQDRERARITMKIQSIIDSTPEPLRDVKFGDSMILRGYQMDPTLDGLIVNLVWEKRGEVNRNRFVHICDEGGNLQAYGPREAQLFAAAKFGQIFEESFLVPNVELDKGCVIAIGFHSAERGMAQIANDVESFGDRRLILVNANQYSKLIRHRRESPKIRVSGEPRIPQAR